ncbi:MAG: hypothetical protein MR425_00140 [Lachnospiraceae bacterium]|nr:hypothetical protein [Lachnospiraceae bacterium]
MVKKGSVIPKKACSHAETEIRNRKQATYEKTGYTGDTYCADCGKLIAKGKAIPKLDKEQQVISAKSYKKVYGAKAFQLNAKTSGTGRLTYTSSNKKVATVNKNGVVKITGVGKTTITIKAAATKGELAAIKNITVTVVPKAIANVNVVAKKAKMTVKVPGAKGVTYIVQYSTNKKFTSGVKKEKVNGAKAVTITKLKSGKTYYVRVMVKKNGQSSSWSKAKSVKVKWN